MQTEHWILFLYALPSGSGSQRVGLWRNLKKMGALPLKTSAYLLPDTPAHYERFQWLAKQLRDGGGEGTLIRTADIEGLPPREIHALFNEARTADYEELNRDLTAVLRANQRKDLSIAVEKLRACFAEIEKIDFFEAPAKHDTLVLWRKVDRLSEPKRNAIPPARRVDFQGKTWLTRPRPEVDRVGSAWLIKTFIDPKAKFVFAPSPNAFPEAVTYDMLDAEFSHSGDDCTFETLIKRFELKDKALQKIAEMVHESDLQDGKFAAIEGEGVHRVLKGLARLDWTDDNILHHGVICFDALYATASNNRNESRGRRDRRR